jgi:predicted dehydrogenase
MTSAPFRWGILGTARINLSRLAGFRQAGHEIAIVGSRDPERGRAHAAALGAERCGSYDDVLAATDIDAVFISLPNALHAPWTIRAAEAGKHVLCEKPFATTVAGCRAMIAAGEANGVRLAEAFMYRHHPQWTVVRNEIAAGTIGRLLMVRAAFGFIITDPKNVKLQPELGGGSMQDIGCYAVNLARWLLGEPIRVSGVALDLRRVGVDTHAAAVLEFASGAIASVQSSFDAELGQSVEIIGERARISIDGAFSARGDMTLRVIGKEGERTIVVPAVNQYGLEFAAFERHVRNGEPLLTPATDAIGTQAVLEAWRAGSGKIETEHR